MSIARCPWLLLALVPLLRGVNEGRSIDPLTTGLFSDPNCTQSLTWSTWREDMQKSHADAIRTASRVLTELSTKGDVISALTDPSEPCMLGAAALLYYQVLAEWHGGRFVPAIVNFATLHDQFLTNMHPHFYDKSSWPMEDKDIRMLKDTLLYNIRKFRALAYDLLDGFASSAAGDKPPPTLEDPRLRENLQGFADHLELQKNQWSKRHQLTANGDATDFVPAWEVHPEKAISSTAIATKSSRVRVFVYDELIPEVGKLTLGPAYCHNRQWGMDVGFHDFFRTSPLRTLDPTEADFFFVPAYAICLQVAGIMDQDDLGKAFQNLVMALPYFARTRGRDHIFSLHYVDLFQGWREWAPLSVFLTPETEVGWEQSREDFAINLATHPPFDSTKDIAVPPFMRISHVLELHHHARPIKDRSVLIAFAGKLWSDVKEAYDVRSRVRDRLRGKPGVSVIVGDSVNDLLSPEAMANLMGNARFCLVPRGRAAWSVRFFETLWAGCVPVVLSDHYEIPIEALFDVTEFVIKWPVARIDDSLYEYLSTLPLDVVELYAQKALSIRCWFAYPPPEVSWLGNSQAHKELERMETELCPGLSSSRNAFEATTEILTRRKRNSKAAMGTSFYWTGTQTGLTEEGGGHFQPRSRGADMQFLTPEHSL